MQVTRKNKRLSFPRYEMEVLRHWSKVVLLLSFGIMVGCASPLPPAFGARDLNVVNTPADYPDNRVFYLDVTNAKNGSTSIVPSWQLDKGRMKSAAMVHNSPLSVLVDAVGLPVQEKNALKDIAIVLDIQSQVSGEARSLVVWYQRGVNSGQTLNFKNLLIHSQEQWDERVAPTFRIRVMDVAGEKNVETRDTLAQVSKFSGALGAMVGNPLAQAAVETATRAASLLLASGANRVMMDYTVQFFDARLVESTHSPNMTPLLTGRFVLAGRSLADLKSEDFWRREAAFDEYNTVIRFTSPDKTVVRSPGVSIQVVNRELILPTQVAARSAYLTKLLTDATNSNLEEMKSTATTLLSDVNALAVREQILRFRQIPDVTELIATMFLDPPTMSNTTMQAAARFIRNITGCASIETGSIQAWWDKVQGDVSFKTPEEYAAAKPADQGVLLKRNRGDLCNPS